LATKSTKEHEKKINCLKNRDLCILTFVFFRGFRGKKIIKSFPSVFFSGFRGKKQLLKKAE